MDQEARAPVAGVPVTVPPFIEEIIAELTHHLRRSPHVNQRSGVSVRFSIGGLETIVASAIRRAVRTGEPEAVPRVSDLGGVVRASMGRIEFESFEEGREAEIIEQLARKAVLDVFRRRLAGFDFAPVLSRFEQGEEVETGDLVTSAELLRQVGNVPSNLLKRLGVEQESPAVAASAIEFALEGLHLSRRLNKEQTAAGARYGA
jgi:magnesium chelatase subunit I